MMDISVAELAARLGAPFEGDGAARLRSIAPLREAAPDALSWAADRRYFPAVAETRAAAVLAPPACPGGVKAALIRVKDPDGALGQVLLMFAPPTPRVPEGVHPTAIVSPDARVAGAAIGAQCIIGAGSEIGPGTQLHPRVYVGDDTRIGRDCVIWPGVVIRERVTLGDRVIVHPNCTIGADGFGYLQRDGRHVKIPQIGTVQIEDDVEIGAGSTIDRARTGATRIGRGTKIDNQVQIGHNCDIGEHCIIVSQSGVSGSCTLGKYVMLGGQVGLADHLTLGDGVRVTAKSGLMNDFPAGTIVGGYPAAEWRQRLRELSFLSKFPELKEQLRDLLRRIERLESAADHRS